MLAPMDILDKYPTMDNLGRRSDKQQNLMDKYRPSAIRSNDEISLRPKVGAPHKKSVYCDDVQRPFLLEILIVGRWTRETDRQRERNVGTDLEKERYTNRRSIEIVGYT